MGEETLRDKVWAWVQNFLFSLAYPKGEWTIVALSDLEQVDRCREGKDVCPFCGNDPRAKKQFEVYMKMIIEFAISGTPTDVIREFERYWSQYEEELKNKRVEIIVKSEEI